MIGDVIKPSKLYYLNIDNLFQFNQHYVIRYIVRDDFKKCIYIEQMNTYKKLSAEADLKGIVMSFIPFETVWYGFFYSPCY